MKIVGANGIATHGRGNVDRVLLELRKLDLQTVDVRLPLRHWFSARWGGRNDAQLIAERSNDGDIVVAHSFGCLRAWYAHQVRDYRAIICIAPAMSRKAEWRHPERVYCWHSSSDWAVRIGSWLAFHPFGQAGIKGFSQSGVTNHKVDGAGHSDYFHGSALSELVRHVARLARDSELSG